MPNNEKNPWWNGYAARIAQAFLLRGDQEEGYERIDELIVEAEKRERERIIKHLKQKLAREESSNDFLTELINEL